MGSTRLKGKVLLPILQKPMVWYSIETLKQSKAIHRIVLAIPDNTDDDPLEEWAHKWNIPCFRGPETDVLKRYYDAALIYKDDYYFRATGDNPILDHKNPARCLQYLVNHRLDYVSEAGLPLGSTVEAFTFNALKRAHFEGTSPQDREHVTWYIKKSGRFNINFILAPPEVNCPNLRLTVDYPEDFQRASTIIENLYQNCIPGLEDVIAFAKLQNWCPGP